MFHNTKFMHNCNGWQNVTQEFFTNIYMGHYFLICSYFLTSLHNLHFFTSSAQQPDWPLVLQAAQTTAVEVGFGLTATWKVAGAYLDQVEAAWGYLGVQGLGVSLNKATQTHPR